MDCNIGVKIPFSDWGLKSSNSRLVRSNECWLHCYLCKPKVHTRNTKPLAAVGFSQFQSVWRDREFFSTFRDISCAFKAHLFLRNIPLHSFIIVDCFFTIDILLSEHKSHQAQQAAKSLPLALEREHSPDINNTVISGQLPVGYALIFQSSGIK